MHGPSFHVSAVISLHKQMCIWRSLLRKGVCLTIHPYKRNFPFTRRAASSYLSCAGGHGTTLILSEQSSVDAERMATGGVASDLASCDLAILLIDSSSLQSMTEALQLLLSVTLAANNSLPCVMLAAKDDLGMSAVRCKTLYSGYNGLAMNIPDALQMSSLYQVLGLIMSASVVTGVLS